MSDRWSNTALVKWRAIRGAEFEGSLSRAPKKHKKEGVLR